MANADIHININEESYRIAWNKLVAIHSIAREINQYLMFARVALLIWFSAVGFTLGCLTVIVYEAIR